YARDELGAQRAVVLERAVRVTEEVDGADAEDVGGASRFVLASRLQRARIGAPLVTPLVAGVGDDEVDVGARGAPRLQCARARHLGIVGMGEDGERALRSFVEDHGAPAIALRARSMPSSSTSRCVIIRTTRGAIVPARTPSLARC